LHFDVLQPLEIGGQALGSVRLFVGGAHFLSRSFV